MKTFFPIACLLAVFSAPALAQDDDAAEGSRQPSIDVNVLIERLADEMDKEFILDRRMAGVFGGTTADADADFETLLGILRASGWVAVEAADQIWVTPDDNMRTLPSRVLQEDDRDVSDHEIVTRIIDFPDNRERGSGDDDGQEPQVPDMATRLVPILRPLMAQSGYLGAPLGTSSLVIVDRYDNVRRIAAVIDEIIAEQGR